MYKDYRNLDLSFSSLTEFVRDIIDNEQNPFNPFIKERKTLNDCIKEVLLIIPAGNIELNVPADVPILLQNKTFNRLNWGIKISELLDIEIDEWGVEVELVSFYEIKFTL